MIHIVNIFKKAPLPRVVRVNSDKGKTNSRQEMFFMLYNIIVTIFFVVHFL